MILAEYLVAYKRYIYKMECGRNDVHRIAVGRYNIDGIVGIFTEKQIAAVIVTEWLAAGIVTEY